MVWRNGGVFYRVCTFTEEHVIIQAMKREVRQSSLHGAIFWIRPEMNLFLFCHLPQRMSYLIFIGR